MASQRAGDRAEGMRRKRRGDAASAPADDQHEVTAASPSPDVPAEQDPPPGRGDEARDRRPSGPPPGTREEPPDASEAPTAAEEIGQTADPDAEPPVHRDDAGWLGYRSTASWGGDWSRAAQPGQQDEYPPASGASAHSRDRSFQPPEERPVLPSPSAPRDEAPRPPHTYNPYDTSSWRVPPGPDAPPRGPYSGQMPVQRGGYSGQFPAQEPAPNQPPRGPYSGQFPAPPPQDQMRRSGTFPVPPDATRSGPFAPVDRGPDDRRSGTFPAVPDAVYQSGTYAAPPDPGAGSYDDPTRSGPMPQSPYISGAMPQVQRSGPFAYPGEVTGTGSRRAIATPGVGRGSLLTDRPALAFLLTAAALAGAMIAFIALRYSHFPDHIALHFGPAGTSQPTRIGEKRELWTIPFIVGIVLAADTALAWAIYRFDRFAARLLTLGSALVAAIAWVVLLTVLHR